MTLYERELVFKLIYVAFHNIEKKHAGGTPPTLVGFDMHLIDTMWPTRPVVPKHMLKLHPLKLAGETVCSKLGRVREALVKESADAVVVSALDQVTKQHAC